jgi:hypothetical protein
MKNTVLAIPLFLLILGTTDRFSKPSRTYGHSLNGAMKIRRAEWAISPMQPNDKLDAQLSVLPGTPAATSSHLFFEARQFPAGEFPYSVAEGDFNGDGKADIVVTNYAQTGGGSTVSVLLGNGDGTFQAPMSYATQYGPSSVAVGDFNGDGKLDLAVSNYCGTDSTCNGSFPPPQSTISILLGNGDGTFQPETSYPVSFGAESVVIADFNHDGKPDLAVASFCAIAPPCSPVGVATVLLGNGDGTFQPGSNYRTSGNPVSLATGDFNGDGKIDLVAANFDNGAGNTVSVLLGNGDGTFGTQKSYTTGSGADSVAVADLNGDGKLDLAVADCGACNPSGSVPDMVSVLLGNGDGTFQAHVDYPAGLYATAVAAGKFSVDGHVDLAEVNAWGDSVGILKGNGDGTFRSAGLYGVGTTPEAVVIGDFNNDNALDLAVTNNSCVGAGGCYGPTGNVSILLGEGDGTFFSRIDHMSGGEGPAGVAVSDFNHDGNEDLAAVNPCTDVRCQNAGSVSILLGNGNGSFRKHVDYALGKLPIFIAVGDFKGDGNEDLAITNEGDDTLSILLGKGDGTFQNAVNYATQVFPNSVAVGDFNGDGVLDLAVSNACGNDPNCYSGGSVTILLGNGDGTFRQGTGFSTAGCPSSIAVSDFNHDNKADIVLTSPEGSNPECDSGSGTVTIFLGKGDGTFRKGVDYQAGPQASSVAVGDFNGDGIADLAVADLVPFPGMIAVLLGNGDGTFQSQVEYPAGNYASTVVTADFNGDGKPDLAVTSAGDNAVSVLLGNGDGTFRGFVEYSIGRKPVGLAAGDFNNDRAVDLVATDATLDVLLNASGSGVVLTSAPNPSHLGETVTFTTTVRGSLEGDPVPTGSVTFEEERKKTTVRLADGVAMYTTSKLTIGKHRVIAHYSGDRHFAPRDSRAIVQQVLP